MASVARSVGRRLWYARAFQSVRYHGGLLYDRHAEGSGLSRLVAALTPEPRPVGRPFPVACIEGQVPDIRFLVGTSAAGLLLFEGPRVTQLFACRGYYGITRRGDRWFAFHKLGPNGRIISFRLEGSRAVDARTEIAGLNRGVHQIDVIDDALWVTDTYNDRVLEIPMAALGRRRRLDPASVRVHYPRGREGIGRGATSPAHFNSVYHADGRVFVVAHNETLKTHQPSEIFCLDEQGCVCERRSLEGSCCHNILVLDGQVVTCRSIEGTLCVGGRDVLRLEAFTRGLSVAEDYWLVGASGAVDDRACRDRAQTRIVITDPTFRRVATITLDATQVNEIRRVDAEDLGLSDARRRPEAGEGSEERARVA